MTEQIPTIGAIFSVGLDDPSKDTVKQVCKQVGLLAGAFGLGRDVPQHYWQAAGTNVLRALASALDKPIDELFVEAWNFYEPFVKYRDSDDQPVQEQLLEHTIEVTCQPTIDVLLDGHKVTELAFDCVVSLYLDGATLTIRGGKFMSLHTGECSAGGSIKYKGAKLIERKTGRFALPGVIRFGDGIPIRPTSRAKQVAAES